MGIYIPNMEKPKSCEECKFESAQYVNNYCRRAFCSLGADYEHCPLIEIVRCGECKKHGKNSCPMTFTYAVITDDNNYCTYAERREKLKK